MASYHFHPIHPSLLKHKSHVTLETVYNKLDMSLLTLCMSKHLFIEGYEILMSSQLRSADGFILPTSMTELKSVKCKNGPQSCRGSAESSCPFILSRIFNMERRIDPSVSRWTASASLSNLSGPLWTASGFQQIHFSIAVRLEPPQKVNLPQNGMSLFLAHVKPFHQDSWKSQGK